MESSPPVKNPAVGKVQPSIRSFFLPRQVTTNKPPPSTSPTLLQSTQQAPIAVCSLPTEINTRLTSDLPKDASILPVAEAHITPLRRINSLLLPISYPDSFYHSTLKPSPPSKSNFSRIILWEDKVVGGLVCRLDPALADDSTPRLPKYDEQVWDIYIQSLALLSPYRGKGLATAVFDSVVRAATEEDGISIRGLYAHVWTENVEALEWYTAQGFKKEGDVLPGYYRRLNPDTAWILRRRLNASDFLQHARPAPQIQANPGNPPPSKETLVTKGISEEEGVTPQKSHLLGQARSFQDRGPDKEWNDLPEDVLGNGLLKPSSTMGTPGEGSGASSRSSSRSGLEGRGKKKRVYPAAAFRC